MEYAIFAEEIKRDYPELLTAVIQQGESSLRYFYLSKGFKDIGKSLIFGYVNIKQESEFKALLARLEEVACSLQIDSIVGPINFTTFFDYRAKLDHFELPSFPGEPKNIQSLPNLLELSGFDCIKKYFSHQFDTQLNFKFHYSIILMGLWGQIRTGWQYKSQFLNSQNYLKFLPEIYEITINTFADNYLFMSISYQAFKLHFENHILPYIHFETSVMMFDKDKKLVGYSLCLMDPNNKEHLLFKTIGVTKTHRKGGFVALQIMRIVYLNARKNFHLCLACLMIEGNKIDRVFKSMSLMTISYGLFQKKLRRGS